MRVVCFNKAFISYSRRLITIRVFPDVLQNAENYLAVVMKGDWIDEEEEATESEMKGVFFTCISLAIFLIAALVLTILLLTGVF